LALEQLGALRGEGREQNSDRFRLRKEGGSNDIEEESKPAPLTPKGAAPPKSKTTAKASLPACHPPRNAKFASSALLFIRGRLSVSAA
jgi:hypothetical protein